MGVPTDGYFTQRTALGAASYVLTFRFNSRMDRWVLDIADANQNVLVSGLVIQGGWPTTKRLRGIIAGLPKGDFLAVDMTGQGRDPDEETMGGDCVMAYYEA